MVLISYYIHFQKEELDALLIYAQCFKWFRRKSIFIC